MANSIDEPKGGRLARPPGSWRRCPFAIRGPELAGAVASGEWAEAAEELAGRSVWRCRRASRGGAVGCSSPEDALHALRPEATRLFVGAPAPAVSPYEGVWRAADDGVQALLFVNPHSMEVERFMRSCGLGRPEGTNEPLDHVATNASSWSTWPCAPPARSRPRERRPAPASPAARPRRPTGPSSRGTPAPGCPASPSAVAAKSRVPFYRDAAALLGALVG